MTVDEMWREMQRKTFANTAPMAYWTDTPEAKPDPPKERDYFAEAIKDLEDFLSR